MIVHCKHAVMSPSATVTATVGSNVRNHCPQISTMVEAVAEMKQLASLSSAFNSGEAVLSVSVDKSCNVVVVLLCKVCCVHFPKQSCRDD